LSLAQAHLMNQEAPLAIDALNQGVRQNPDSKELRRALARVYAAKKDFSAAEEQLVKITEIDPKDLRALGDLGDFRMSRSQYDEARKLYEKIVEQAPEVPGGYLKLARLNEVKGDRDAAIQILEKGYTANADSMPLLAALVKAYTLDGKTDRPLKLCEEKIAAYPDNAFTYNLLAQVHLADKNPQKAEKALKEAIRLNPQWNVPHDNLARLYLSQGKTDEAIQNLETAIAQNEKNTAAFMTLAFLHQKNGDLDKARSVYEKALAADPNRWAAANNLAFLLSENPDSAADLDRALELAGKAEKMKPDDPTVLDTIGWVYKKKGNLEMALTVFEKALEKSPDTGVIHYHLAQVLIDSDRTDEAREHLEKALADEKGFPEKKEAEALLKEIDS